MCLVSFYTDTLAVPDHPNNNHIFKHLVRKGGRQKIREKVEAVQQTTTAQRMKKKYAIGPIKYTEVLEVICNVMVQLNDAKHKKSLENSIRSIWGNDNEVSEPIKQLMLDWNEEYADKTDAEIFPNIAELEEKKQQYMANGIEYDDRLIKYKNPEKAYACNNKNCTFTYSSKYNARAKNHVEYECPFSKPYGCIPMVPTQENSSMTDDLIMENGFDDYKKSRIDLKNRFFCWNDKPMNAKKRQKYFEYVGMALDDMGNGLIVALCRLKPNKHKTDNYYYLELFDIQRLRKNGQTDIWQLKKITKVMTVFKQKRYNWI